MTNTQFSVALVHQFGDWPGEGMKLTVAEYLKGYTDLDLRRLFQWIVKHYVPKRPGPPVLAEILMMWQEIPALQGISLPEPGLSDQERQQLADELYAMLQKLIANQKIRVDQVSENAQGPPAEGLPTLDRGKG